MEIVREALGGLKGEGIDMLEKIGEGMIEMALKAVVRTVGSVYRLVVVAGVVIGLSGLGMKWERVVL